MTSLLLTSTFRPTKKNRIDLSASPFVPMKPIHRYLIIGFYWLWMFAVSLGALINQTAGAEWVIPMLIIFTIVSIFPLLLYKETYGWFHPVIFGLVLSIDGLLRTWPQYVWGISYHDALPGYSIERLANLTAYSLGINTISLLSYYGGFAWAPAGVLPRLSFTQPKQLSKKVIITVIGTVTLFLIYLQSQGGLNAHLLAFWGGGRGNAIEAGSGVGLWTVLVRAGLISCFIWLATNHQAPKQWVFYICFGVSLATDFLISGSRGALISSVSFGLLLWMFQERRILFTPLLVAGLSGIVILSALGELRISTYRGTVDWSAITRISWVDDFNNGIEEIRQRSTERGGPLPVYAYVPDQIDLLYGQTYITLLTTPIPRALWPTKPRAIGALSGETFYNTNAGVPIGSVGEAYWNFHIPGVIIVFGLFGMFQKWLMLFFSRYRQQPVLILFYLYTLYYLEPSVKTITNWLQATVTLVLLAWLYGLILINSRRANAS